MLGMMDSDKFKVLMRRAHATSKQKGWWTDNDGNAITLRREDDSIDAPQLLKLHALIHSEFSEAYKEWRLSRGRDRMVMRIEDGKPEGFVVEIADVVIRIADMFEALGVEALGVCQVGAFTLLQEYTDEMTPLLAQTIARVFVDDATEHARKGQAWSTIVCLYACVLTCEQLCNFLALDLDGAIAAKLDYNKTRPYRHGGKLA